MTNQDCIFCKIIRGDLPAKKIHEDADLIAFEDINKAAPCHVLIIPKEHISSVNDLSEKNSAIVSKIFLAAQQLARDAGIQDSGYRLVANTGRGAGQSVFHLHVHLLGGRPLSWPPG